MKNKFQFIAIFALTLLIVTAPLLVLAQEPSADLVPCFTKRSPNPCEFKDVMALINRVINFVLFGLSIPIAAIMFAYGGFLMIKPGGESASARTKAKNIFSNAIIGLVLGLASWLIIHTILTTLGYKGDWIGL